MKITRADFQTVK